MCVAGAVGRAIEEAAAIIDRGERGPFAGDERIARETLSQHAVKAHERSLRIVAAQRVERVAGSIQRIDAVTSRPKIDLRPSRADHSHAQTAVRLEVAW